MAIKVAKKDKILCAKYRKGHFEGVIDVMTRLTKIVKPSKIFMGEKDFQQLILVKKYIENNFKSKILKSDFKELLKISNNFDAIVTDLPYGKSSKTSEKPEEILKRFISIVPKNKKIAIMFKKELDPKMKLKGLKKYQIYRHKSLTRTILIK